MSLDWDILLDDVSIKDQIARFEVRDSDGGYARELTIDAADPSFYDQFEFNVLPQLRLEVKVKETDTWVSLGRFYIEQPGLAAGPDEISGQGLWGRSETAKAGAPFAPKVTQSWDTDTTANAIINEMAALCDLTVNFDLTDYTVFAGSYAVDGAYPIDVIRELAEYAGGTVGCTADGDLVVRPYTFHPSSADHTVTDTDISGMTESVEYPEFGNRIKISADGSDSGVSVDVEAADDADCLPANGTSKNTLYAFVSNNDGPVDDGVVVSWTAEDGVTLANETSQTGQVLMANKIHNADNYYTVTVDYPVIDVIGIWAYSDRQHENNFWDASLSGCAFEDNEITVHNPFLYCDQTLVVTYITSGCAVNTVTAGSTAQDVTVTADVNGTQDTIEVKLGNTCACGSSLEAIKNTDSDICFGNSAPILIWAEINGGPATGMIATLTLTGCGELSSTKKILGSVDIINEVGHVINNISGTSQVECAAFPDDSATPEVYLVTDASKSDNLYAGHDGKVIDLDTEIATGTEVWIDYTADGAATVSWLTDDVEEECDAEVLIKIADGTETGLTETVSLRATDCSDLDGSDSSDETTSVYSSSKDSNGFDNSGTKGGTTSCEAQCNKLTPASVKQACIDACKAEEGESGGVTLDSCDIIILNRISNIDNATAETKDNIRFGITSQTVCAEADPYGCPCSELCESEVRVKGNTYDYNKTIHETVIDTYEEGTPEYYEAVASLRSEVLAECETNCEGARNEHCGNCTASGPNVLAPGESAEYICSDGTTRLITMPDDGCGVVEFTVGCCTVNIKSTDGQWVVTDNCSWNTYQCYSNDQEIAINCYPECFGSYYCECDYLNNNCAVWPDYSCGPVCTPVDGGDRSNKCCGSNVVGTKTWEC